MPYTLQDLINAGLPATFTDGIEADFSRSLTPEERIIADGIMYPDRIIKATARANAKAIPDWAGWTETEVLAWLQTNIGTPLTTPIPANPMTVQQIRAVLVSIVSVMDKMYIVEKSMARMIVALRDEVWFDLEDL